MRKLFSFLFLSLSFFLSAQAPENYYDAAHGKSNEALRLALQDIIDGHTNVGYNGLWAIYTASDTRGGKVWDMYSTCDWTPDNNQCGNYSTVCDCYNREHSVPQSWFGERSPMVSDAFHIYPTDGKVNGQRSNYPFGECTGGVKCDNSPKALGRLGTSTFAGYSGRVFEPDDEYKGDFARTYFYMATRYANENFTSSEGGAVFTYSNSKCNLTPYAVNLFLKWHRNDPVSDKEITRNNAIYNAQHNRNPFIDIPELAEYIWGNKTSETYSGNGGGDEPSVHTVYLAGGLLQISNLVGGGEIRIYSQQGMLLSGICTNASTVSLPLPSTGIIVVNITDNAGNESSQIINQ